MIAATEQPKVETIKIKVDGRTIEVPKTMPDPITGKPVPTSMIQATELAKTFVPHYCYHPKLPVAGNCRMCLVEFGTPAMGPDRKPLLNEDGTPKIAKSPRPAIACATPISPGMEIYTDTPAVRQMREGVLEFLLINHPLDCPICDQAGECRLQEFSVEYGRANSRFVDEKVHKPKQVEIGPRVMLDAERCILCSRCIRFSRDIAKDDVLGFIQRGSYNTLTTYPGKQLANNYSLNTVDICPVGALTSRDFRFKMRVWFLKEIKSVCNGCATGCNILVGSRENVIYRFTPRENEQVNLTWMCDYGRMLYKPVQDPSQLKKPQKRVNGALMDIPWAQAISEVVGVFKSAPAGSVAIVGSGRLSNEELFLLKKLNDQLGAAACDIVPRSGEADDILFHTDRNPNTMGAKLMGVTGENPGARLKEIVQQIGAGKVKHLLVAGEDVTKAGFEAPTLSKLSTLIVIDRLPNPTTDVAHYVLPGAFWLEKRGSFTNFKGIAQKYMAAVLPPEDARADWEIFRELLIALGGRLNGSTIEGIFNEIGGGVEAFQGIQWKDLGDFGKQVKLPAPVNSGPKLAVTGYVV